MKELMLAVAAILVCQAMQALDDLFSQFGVVSVAHGMLLGYGQVYAAKAILEWGGASLGWAVVTVIGIAALAVSVYRIHHTGTRWVFAFNFGVVAGVICGGIALA